MRQRYSRKVAALSAAIAAALSAAAPAVAGRAAAPAGHPTNSGNSANASSVSHGKPPTTPGHGAPSSGSANGIAQTVGSTSVVLTQLDGSTVSISVVQSTRVYVNGSHATLGDVKPGFVISASWVAGKTKLLEAFSPSGVEVGIVSSVSAKAVVVTLSDGSKVTVRLGPRTHLFLDGNPAALRAVKTGDTVVFSASLKRNAFAAAVHFLSPG